MTDLSGLKSVWQKELYPLHEDETKSVYQKEKYLEKLEAYGEKFNNAHGWTRLRKPFVIATKVAWLRRKKMKIEKHLAADAGEVKKVASDVLSNLADATARDSVNGDKFKYLETAIRQMQDAREIVNKAAKKCRNASIAEGVAAVGDEVPVNTSSSNSDEVAAAMIALAVRVGADIAANIASWKATRAFREAEEEVQLLQQRLQQQMPRVNGALANDIAWSNNSTLMMDTFGGILAGFANWNMATQLNDAKNHLHHVTDQLGDTISELSQEKQALAQTAFAEARKTDSSIGKFAAELENYMLPIAQRKPVEKPVLKKRGLRLIKRR